MEFLYVFQDMCAALAPFMYGGEVFVDLGWAERNLALCN